jgi:glutamate N-acetyltransferase/amino-acid N-acetyltransferase
MKFKLVPGSIVAAKGFLAAGVFCDIKRLGTGRGSNKGRKRDLALIFSEAPAVAAGLFTTNQICAAPVKVCLAHLKKGRARAVVVNSGNANACTGKEGLKDATDMAELTAKALNAQPPRAPSDTTKDFRRLTVGVDEVLVASTGRIGVPLPMENVRRGIFSASELLEPLREKSAHVAEAIMTSDTRPKEIALEFSLGGKTVRLGGVCKGAGMIQPGMSDNGARPAAMPLHATMLCFITTDAEVERGALQKCLREAVAQSFNRITVDGDMSTNDSVIVLANGMARNRRVTDSSTATAKEDRAIFQSALNHVCLELAKMIVRDGEGVSRFVTVHLEGAKSFVEADAAARAVANSALVKTSWHGGDPNWGRIIAALGYSGAEVREKKVDIAYSRPGGKKRLYSLRRGQPTVTPFRTLCKLVAQREFDLHINLNLGRGEAVIYAGDLTEDYVDFNKGDVKDPASMGG